MLSYQHNWIVAGALVLGTSHQSSGTPCQDHYCHKAINETWGVAVVCDGAGSYDYSQLGSRFVSHHTAALLEKELYKARFIQSGSLPTEEVWRKLALKVLKKVQQRLLKYAASINLEFEELSCTVIAVVYCPKGILVAHIGDGRAAFTTDATEWEALITPYSGSMPGSTIFITQNVFKKSLPEHIESRIVQGEIKGLALMTDGCESVSFHCYEKQENSDVLLAINTPKSDFFTHNTDFLKGQFQKGLTPSQINSRWVQYLENGTKQLEHEPDDKTLLLIIPCTPIQKEK